MCYDPWELDIYRFAILYQGALQESRHPDRTENSRRLWQGKAELFEEAYRDKLSELDDKELSDHVDELVEDGVTEEVIQIAEHEQKRRADDGVTV